MVRTLVTAVVFGGVALSVICVVAVTGWNVASTYRLHAQSELLGRRHRKPT
jgi:hypothetical protein